MIAGGANAAFSAELLPPKIYTQTPGGVNLSDGSFLYRKTDISIGLLTLERYHLGGPSIALSKYFGTNWTHSFDIYVRVSPSGPPINTYFSDVHTADSSFTFSGAAGGATISPWNKDAYGVKLEKIGGNFKFTDRAGTIYNFSSTVVDTTYEKVSSIVYPNGRTLTFSYNGSDQLKEIADNSGYAIIFDYGANGFVSAACGFNLTQSIVTPTSTCALAGPKQSVSYGYSASPVYLTSVIDRTGQTTTFGYQPSPAYVPASIICVKPPGYAVCKVANTYPATPTSSTFYQVQQQTFATGEVWKFRYNGNYAGYRLHGDGSDVTINFTTVTDPNLKDSVYGFVDASPISAKDANLHQTDYSFFGNDWKTAPPHVGSGTYLGTVKFSEGNQFSLQYDSRYNKAGYTLVPKVGSGLTNITTSSVFPATGTGSQVGYCNTVDPKICNKPISSTDAKGGETDYTYAVAHGGVLTEMGPAPTAGAPRPLKVYTYAQKFASLKNASGTLVPAATPVWVRTSETDCQTTGATVCDAAAPQILTSYEYGAQGTVNQLLVTGMVVDSGGLNLRTCYSYDWAGNKISETKPRAGLASCP